MTTFALLLLILLATAGNLLLGFWTAIYFGHGPKGLPRKIREALKGGLFVKPAQKSPQSPH
jgi:hypothetical protein